MKLDAEGNARVRSWLVVTSHLGDEGPVTAEAIREARKARRILVPLAEDKEATT